MAVSLVSDQQPTHTVLEQREVPRSFYRMREFSNINNPEQWYHTVTLVQERSLTLPYSVILTQEKIGNVNSIPADS